MAEVEIPEQSAAGSRDGQLVRLLLEVASETQGDGPSGEVVRRVLGALCRLYRPAAARFVASEGGAAVAGCAPVTSGAERPSEWPDPPREPSAEVVRGPVGSNRLAMMVPVVCGDELLGRLEVLAHGRPPGEAPPRFEDEVLLSVGALLGSAVERRRLGREAAGVAERERRSLGHELHDVLGQDLTGLALLADTLETRLAERGLPETELAGELVEIARSCQRSVRSLIRGLLPVEVDPDGLMSALTELAATTRRLHGVECRLRCSEPLRLEDGFAATQLFRIASEAVHNAVRHGQPSRVLIALERRAARLALTVTDDGRGLSEGRPRGAGLGLRVMRYRASLLDGELAVESRPGEGTRVRCDLELPAATGA
ncbi:MAG: sensor histidine kinase [Thermoanaerobaculia bacterium]|nr:sensor histidine kinase [Thermoanaerobaculia bacterium]